jgi:hypothetical protein
LTWLDPAIPIVGRKLFNTTLSSPGLTGRSSNHRSFDAGIARLTIAGEYWFARSSRAMTV